MVVYQDGLVIAEKTTPANESDIWHLEAPLEKSDLKQWTFTNEIEKTNHVQGTEEPKVDITRDNRKQGHKQGAL